MPSALEDYMMRMGYGSSATGSLGITPPPAPDLVVPRFTSIGDRMAAIGGFGDQPGELKTVEQLRRMSQQEIDEYERLRKSARNRGISESLIAIGQAFEGKTPSSLGTKQTFERFGVYDPTTKELKFSVPKDAADLIRQYEKAGFIVGQLRSPTFQNANVEIYELQDANGNFIENITEDDWLTRKAEGTLPKGSKLLDTPKAGQPGKTIDIDDLSKQYSDFENRWDATTQLVNALQSTADFMYANPKSALATTGNISQFVDSVIQNFGAASNILSKADEDPIYQGMEGGVYVTVEGSNFNEQIKEASRNYGVAESKIRDLAYLFAAARGQEGRGLSDKDYENALRIVSGGVGVNGRIAVLKDVAQRLKEDIEGTFNNKKSRYDYLRSLPGAKTQQYDKYINEIDALFQTPIPTFNDPFAQPAPKPTTQTTSQVDDLIKKYS